MKANIENYHCIHLNAETMDSCISKEDYHP